MGLLCWLLVFFSQGVSLPGLQSYWIQILSCVITALISGYVALLMGQTLNRFVTWKQRHALRFVVQTLSLLVCGLVIMSLYLECFVMNSSSSLSYMQWWQLYQETFLKGVIILMILVVCYTLLDLMYYSYHELRQEEVRSAELINNQLNLQFDALRSQLSPHFLFNSLNTISSLLYKDPILAERFIRRFAQTYQFILDQNEESLIPLEKEISFVKAYNFLLEIRFENAYHLHINLPNKALKTLIPPMSLQMLVENAIKHNKVSRTTPLEVNIDFEDQCIQVKNNINPLTTHPTSFHIGIDNLKKRYAYFTQKNIELTKDEHFIVTLPLITTTQTINN